MANNLACNPLVVDTAAATDLAIEVTGRAGGVVRLGGLTWANGTAADDGAVIEDAAGHVIWEDKWGGASVNLEGHNVVFSPPLWVHGLAVTTLDGGTLYINVG